MQARPSERTTEFSGATITEERIMKKKNSFAALSLELKASIIEEFASPLISIEYYDHRIDLFSLNTLLIERHRNIDSGQIEKITEATYHELDKYLSRIVIGKLKEHLLR